MPSPKIFSTPNYQQEEPEYQSMESWWDNIMKKGKQAGTSLYKGSEFVLSPSEKKQSQFAKADALLKNSSATANKFANANRLSKDRINYEKYLRGLGVDPQSSYLDYDDPYMDIQKVNNAVLSGNAVYDPQTQNVYRKYVDKNKNYVTESIPIAKISNEGELIRTVLAEENAQDLPIQTKIAKAIADPIFGTGGSRDKPRLEAEREFSEYAQNKNLDEVRQTDSPWKAFADNLSVGLLKPFQSAHNLVNQGIEYADELINDAPKTNKTNIINAAEVIYPNNPYASGFGQAVGGVPVVVGGAMVGGTAGAIAPGFVDNLNRYQQGEITGTGLAVQTGIDYSTFKLGNLTSKIAYKKAGEMFAKQSVNNQSGMLGKTLKTASIDLFGQGVINTPQALIQAITMQAGRSYPNATPEEREQILQQRLSEIPEIAMQQFVVGSTIGIAISTKSAVDAVRAMNYASANINKYPPEMIAESLVKSGKIKPEDADAVVQTAKNATEGLDGQVPYVHIENTEDGKTNFNVNKIDPNDPNIKQLSDAGLLDKVMNGDMSIDEAMVKVNSQVVDANASPDSNPTAVSVVEAVKGLSPHLLSKLKSDKMISIQNSNDEFGNVVANVKDANILAELYKKNTGLSENAKIDPADLQKFIEGYYAEDLPPYPNGLIDLPYNDKGRVTEPADIANQKVERLRAWATMKKQIDDAITTNDGSLDIDALDNLASNLGMNKELLADLTNDQISDIALKKILGTDKNGFLVKGAMSDVEGTKINLNSKQLRKKLDNALEEPIPEAVEAIKGVEEKVNNEQVKQDENLTKLDKEYASAKDKTSTMAKNIVDGIWSGDKIKTEKSINDAEAIAQKYEDAGMTDYAAALRSQIDKMVDDFAAKHKADKYLESESKVKAMASKYVDASPTAKGIIKGQLNELKNKFQSFGMEEQAKGLQELWSKTINDIQNQHLKSENKKIDAITKKGIDAKAKEDAKKQKLEDVKAKSELETQSKKEIPPKQLLTKFKTAKNTLIKNAKEYTNASAVEKKLFDKINDDILSSYKDDPESLNELKTIWDNELKAAQEKAQTPKPEPTETAEKPTEPAPQAAENKGTIENTEPAKEPVKMPKPKASSNSPKASKSKVVKEAKEKIESASKSKAKKELSAEDVKEIAGYDEAIATIKEEIANIKKNAKGHKLTGSEERIVDNKRLDIQTLEARKNQVGDPKKKTKIHEAIKKLQEQNDKDVAEEQKLIKDLSDVENEAGDIESKSSANIDNFVAKIEEAMTSDLTTKLADTPYQIIEKLLDPKLGKKVYNEIDKITKHWTEEGRLTIKNALEDRLRSLVKEDPKLDNILKDREFKKILKEANKAGMPTQNLALHLLGSMRKIMDENAKIRWNENQAKTQQQIEENRNLKATESKQRNADKYLRRNQKGLTTIITDDEGKIIALHSPQETYTIIDDKKVPVQGKEITAMDGTKKTIVSETAFLNALKKTGYKGLKIDNNGKFNYMDFQDKSIGITGKKGQVKEDQNADPDSNIEILESDRDYDINEYGKRVRYDKYGNVIDDDYQLSSSNKPINRQLNNKIAKMLKPFGVSIENVNDIVTKNGNSAVAVTDTFNKIIKVAKGKADVTTLPEEAIHMLSSIIGDADPNLFVLKNNIKNWDQYDKYYNEYAKEYNYNQRKIDNEIVTKFLTESLIKEYKANTFGARFKNTVKNLIDKFKAIINSKMNIAFPDAVNMEDIGKQFAKGMLWNEGITGDIIKNKKQRFLDVPNNKSIVEDADIDGNYYQLFKGRDKLNEYELNNIETGIKKSPNYLSAETPEAKQQVLKDGKMLADYTQKIFKASFGNMSLNGLSRSFQDLPADIKTALKDISPKELNDVVGRSRQEYAAESKAVERQFKEFHTGLKEHKDIKYFDQVASKVYMKNARIRQSALSKEEQNIAIKKVNNNIAEEFKKVGVSDDLAKEYADKYENEYMPLYKWEGNQLRDLVSKNKFGVPVSELVNELNRYDAVLENPQSALDDLNYKIKRLQLEKRYADPEEKKFYDEAIKESKQEIKDTKDLSEYKDTKKKQKSIRDFLKSNAEHSMLNWVPLRGNQESDNNYAISVRQVNTQGEPIKPFNEAEAFNMTHHFESFPKDKGQLQEWLKAHDAVQMGDNPDMYLITPDDIDGNRTTKKQVVLAKGIDLSENNSISRGAVERVQAALMKVIDANGIDNKALKQSLSELEGIKDGDPENPMNGMVDDVINGVNQYQKNGDKELLKRLASYAIGFNPMITTKESHGVSGHNFSSMESLFNTAGHIEQTKSTNDISGKISDQLQHLYNYGVHNDYTQTLLKYQDIVTGMSKAGVKDFSNIWKHRLYDAQKIFDKTTGGVVLTLLGGAQFSAATANYLYAQIQQAQYFSGIKGVSPFTKMKAQALGNLDGARYVFGAIKDKYADIAYKLGKNRQWLNKYYSDSYAKYYKNELTKEAMADLSHSKEFGQNPVDEITTGWANNIGNLWMGLNRAVEYHVRAGSCYAAMNIYQRLHPFELSGKSKAMYIQDMEAFATEVNSVTNGKYSLADKGFTEAKLASYPMLKTIMTFAPPALVSYRNFNRLLKNAFAGDINGKRQITPLVTGVVLSALTMGMASVPYVSELTDMYEFLIDVATTSGSNQIVKDPETLKEIIIKKTDEALGVDSRAVYEALQRGVFSYLTDINLTRQQQHPATQPFGIATEFISDVVKDLKKEDKDELNKTFGRWLETSRAVPPSIKKPAGAYNRLVEGYYLDKNGDPTNKEFGILDAAKYMVAGKNTKQSLDEANARLGVYNFDKPEDQKKFIKQIKTYTGVDVSGKFKDKSKEFYQEKQKLIKKKFDEIDNTAQIKAVDDLYQNKKNDARGGKERAKKLVSKQNRTKLYDFIEKYNIKKSCSYILGTPEPKSFNIELQELIKELENGKR